MLDLYNLLLAQIGGNPRVVFSVFGGLLLSWAATQKAKFWLPATWGRKLRELSTQSIAFATAGLTTVLLWGAATGNTADSIVAGTIVGLLSPALWNWGTYLVGLWKPEVAERLRKGECE